MIPVKDLQMPKLNYSLNSLEPVISSRIMDLHYNKHHAGYLNKLKAGLKGTPYEEKPLKELFFQVQSLPEEISTIVKNHGGGFWNHAFFWEVLRPTSEKKEISSFLKESLVSSFGSLENFRSEFERAGSSVFGSGWVWLVYDPSTSSLKVITTPNQVNPLMIDSSYKILLGVDVWEHAYYLDYYNDRGKYLSSIWDIINWGKVGELFANKADAS